MQKNNKTLQACLSSTAGIIVVAAILIIVGMIFKNTNLRIDCTEDKLYTLSDTTKETLKKIDKKITLRFYYSKNVAQMPISLKNYAKRIDDILREYEIYGNGSIRVEKLNPKPDTDAEDSANLDGVVGQGSGALGLEDNIYLGIAIRCGDRLETLPFLSPERESLLEYDLTRAILNVSRPTARHKLGIMSSMKIFGGIDNPQMMMMGQGGMKPAWLIVNELKKEYDVTELPMTTEEIPSDIDIVIAVHPKDASDNTMFALDQFVLRGGRLIAFLDPICVADMQNQPQQMQYMPPNASSTLGKLLTAWGIDFSVDNVVVDRTCATTIQQSANSRPEAMPTVLSLDEKNLTDQDPSTTQISTLLMLNAGAFTGTPAEGLTKTILISSSDDSQMLEKYMTQRNGSDILKDFHSDEKTKELAIRLTGTFKTAFPDGKPAKADEKKDETKPETQQNDNSLKASSTPGAVVLISDADMVYDAFCVRQNSIFGQTFYQPINNNLAFVQNLVETLSGDVSLYQIRSRGVKTRPFTKVKELERLAADKFQSEINKFESEVQNFRQELYSMQSKRNPGDKELLSKQQKEAVAKIKKKEAEASKNLKKVRKDMRKDIESLESNIMFVNIGLMPLLVILGGISLAFVKRMRQ